MKNKSYLITGGARSGKSRYALKLGENAKRPFYIATGWAGDKEMAERISKHKAERDERWTTIESRTEIAEAIKEAETDGADFILVDCLTLWTSNMLHEKASEIDKMTEELAKLTPNIAATLVFVTNEVGGGIVPGDKLSRDFRDAAGITNQKIAAVADNVILAVSGIPVKIK